MKNKKRFAWFVLLFVGLTGCMENDKVEPWQEDMVESIIDKEWQRIAYSDEEIDAYEIWTFNINASGTYKSIAIFKDGTVKEERDFYFKWSFTSSSYDMIYMDDDRYWQIDKLTAEKLCITETLQDPLAHPEANKEYKEYSLKK